MPFPPSQEGLGKAEAIPVGPGPGPRVSPDAEPQGPPWNPPLPIWLFLLLHVLSFGFFTFFWITRVAGDIRRHLDQEARAWRYFLGYLVGIVQPFVVVKLGQHFATLNARQGQRVGPPIWVMVTLAVVNLPLYFVSWRLEFEEQAARDLAIVFVILIVTGLPWFLLQRQLNVFKARLENVAWTAPPHRLTVPHYFVLSVGLLFWGISTFGIVVESYDFDLDPLPAGVALEPASEIRGDSGFYALSAPGPGWRRLPKGSIAEGADLELAGPSADTRLVVYVNPAGDQSLDDFVDYRRKLIRESSASLKIEEVRHLLGDGMVPVSFARYDTRNPQIDQSETYWVATLRRDATRLDEATVIEVIGWANLNGSSPIAAERLVKSLTLQAQGPKG